MCSAKPADCCSRIARGCFPSVRSRDAITLEHARIAAEAELELGRVGRVRLARIDRASALGTLDAPKNFPSADHELT